MDMVHGHGVAGRVPCRVGLWGRGPRGGSLRLLEIEKRKTDFFRQERKSFALERQKREFASGKPKFSLALRGATDSELKRKECKAGTIS